MHARGAACSALPELHVLLAEAHGLRTQDLPTVAASRTGVQAGTLPYFSGEERAVRGVRANCTVTTRKEKGSQEDQDPVEETP